MMQYKTIIVDDEAHALVTLSSYIEKMPNLTLCGSYENPLDALEILADKEPPDIAFLDIDMPELSGLALADLADSRVQIVFTSAHQQYTLDAFGVFASGYLLKPFSFETFLKTVKNVCTRISKVNISVSPKSLLFQTGLKGNYINIMSDQIIFIEAMLNYVKIHTAISEKPKVIYLSLKKAETEFEGTNFIRVSRSFVINITFLDEINGNNITMKNGKKISIGPSYKTSFHNYVKSNAINGKKDKQN